MTSKYEIAETIEEMAWLFSDDQSMIDYYRECAERCWTDKMNALTEEEYQQQEKLEKFYDDIVRYLEEAE